MDPIFQQAFEFSNYQSTLSNHRKVLKEKIESKLTIGFEGGIFKIDRALITFVQMLIDRNRKENVPILDINENPVLIKNLEEFRDEIFDRYFSVVNEYFIEFQEIKKNRSVKKLIKYE